MALKPNYDLISANASTAAVVLKKQISDYQKPTKGEDFIALQADLVVAQNNTTEENLELKNSLTPGKTTKTGSAPTVNLSHYYKGSGTEGTNPEIYPFLESLMGANRVATTERTTTAGSTTSVLKCANATEFLPGDAVLVKDGVNGWGMRPVLSVTGTTDVNLAFPLDAAPASGVKMGKCSTFFPRNSELPVFDFTHFLDGGKAGAEYVANCRTDSISITANPSTGMNCSFSCSGPNYKPNPSDLQSQVYFIDGTNNKFKITDGTNETLVSIPENEYRVTSTTPAETLANALQTAIRGVSGRNSLTTANYTVTYSTATEKYTFAKGGSDTQIGFDFNISVGDITPYLGFTSRTVAKADSIVAPNKSAPDTSSKLFRVTPLFDQSVPPSGVSQYVFVRDKSAPVGSQVLSLDCSTFSFNVTNASTTIPSLARDSGQLATFVSSRTGTFQFEAPLEPYDSTWFNRFDQSTSLEACFVWGVRENGNWKPGNCGIIYSPTCSVSDYSTPSSNSIFTVNATLSLFSSGTESPLYLNFL